MNICCKFYNILIFTDLCLDVKRFEILISKNFYMDLIEPETGKITIDHGTLIKLLLLVLFGIAVLLTMIKLFNCMIYKIYVKFCKKKEQISNGKSQKSVSNLVDPPGNNIRIQKQSTFIQIESEDDNNIEHSGPGFFSFVISFLIMKIKSF